MGGGALINVIEALGEQFNNKIKSNAQFNNKIQWTKRNESNKNETNSFTRL